MPVGLHDQALAYNVELFSKAGLPAPPASWDDGSWTYAGSFSCDAAQALTLDQAGRPADQSGFDPSTIVQYGVARIPPEAFFYGFGGHRYNGSTRRAQFDTSAALQGAQFAGDLVNRYHVQPTASQLANLSGAGATADPALASWLAGRLAMIEMCSCELRQPLRLAGAVPVAGWRPLPSGPRARRDAGRVRPSGPSWLSSTQHDLAWETLKFFTFDSITAQEAQLAVRGIWRRARTARQPGDAFPKGIERSAGVGVDPAVWITPGIPHASAENDTWIPAFVPRSRACSPPPWPRSSVVSPAPPP